MGKLAIVWFVGLSMVAIGCLHFAEPGPFVRIVPEILPAPLFLVYLSGACEVAGGLGLFFRRSRPIALLGLIALYLAVFPANLNMALNEIQLVPDGTLPVWAMWARLPLQLLLIALLLWLRKPGSRDSQA